jgi:hypothetical protein
MELQRKKYPHERTCRGCKLGMNPARGTLAKPNARSKHAVSGIEDWRLVPTVRIILVIF